MKDPGQYDRFNRVNCEQKHDGKCIDVIYGIKNNKSEIQALRYPKKIWTVDAAKNHCESRKGKFEAASDKEPEGMINRAYSLIEIKSIDEEKRIIEGIATTPAPDRLNDVVIPEGIQFKLPLPFLYQHNSRQPIGKVIEAKATEAGMPVKIQVAEAGLVLFIDEAWTLIKTGLVRGLSIGFRSLEESWDKTINGFRYLKTELLEISAVTIPANAEATITSVKSAVTDELAALGHGQRRIVQIDGHDKHPGVAGIDKGKKMKTIQEQIASFEAKRQALSARAKEIIDKAGEEGRTLDEAEAEEHDGLLSEISTIDDHLKRLRAHEKEIVSQAVPITEKEIEGPEASSRIRGNIIRIKDSELPQGTAFVRYAMALSAARGNRHEALQMASSFQPWKDTTPEVLKVLNIPDQVLKAAVAAGTTTATGWAAELADYTYMASEFIEYLRPMTIIGKLPLRRVPFNIKIPLQNAGATVNWVGEGARKPVGKLGFDTIEFRFFKASGIVVITEELVRFSNPSAEALVRSDMSDTIVQFLDEEFVDPTQAGTANVAPASITNGAANAAASGTDADAFRSDLKDALSTLITANIDPSGLSVIMQPTQAVALSLMRNALGQKEFPDITASGGTIEGYTVVTSNSVPSGVIIFLKPSEILLADDDGIELAVSREASIVMDDGGSPSVTTMHSMFQEDKVALRVERIINWARRRDDAVYYLTSCDYGAASSPS